MNKKKIALSLGAIGVIGMSTVSPVAYAADSTDVNDSAPTTEFRHGRGPGRGEEHEAPPQMSEEDIAAMSTILETNNFEAFLETTKEHAPANAPEMTDEMISKLQERFDKMVELYNSGEERPWHLGPISFGQDDNRRELGEHPDDTQGPRGDHRGFGPKMMGDQETMSTILENQDFDAFVELMKQNAPNDAPEMTDEHLEALQNHFDRMIERYQAGEMPWQNK